jgi:exo-beta-1,3-glucanase (GH17 family)
MIPCRIIYIIIVVIFTSVSCGNHQKQEQVMQSKKQMTAKNILGNSDYLAISYGGYREKTREVQPTIKELKDDMKILAAMGVGILRTYNVHLDQASNILTAIKELKNEDASFEMYVMLGAWIDCKNAWTNRVTNHELESSRNAEEIEQAVSLAQKHPDIVKIIAVGNEAMVHWATTYFVRPHVILKWVNYLQDLKKSGDLSKDLWITSSDNFAAWGGGDPVYHTKDLEKLVNAVDYISMHTYAFHDTHYNPTFWNNDSINRSTDLEIIKAAMTRAKNYAISQYQGVKSYVESLGVEKPIHIGESGWATVSNGYYGPEGSIATDEFKAALYYKYMREWTNEEELACFYFEAFNEIWKDYQNPEGSENHFGLITRDGQAKYALWDLVDQNKFQGLTRNGNPITKTYDGNLERLLNAVSVPEIQIINN